MKNPYPLFAAIATLAAAAGAPIASHTNWIFHGAAPSSNDLVFSQPLTVGIYSNHLHVQPRVIRFRFDIPREPITNITVVDIKNIAHEPEHLDLQFYTQWIVETNTTTPRPTMEAFTPLPFAMATNGFFWMNASSVTNSYFLPPCLKEHLDTSEHTDITYVSSNLVAVTLWRNRTNVNFIESIPVQTLTNKWHYEKTRVYSH